MDISYTKSILDGLKSTSSSKVQESLLKIRSKIIINDNGIKLFRECNGLDYLLPHLRKPNEKILDLTLSILGNCCLEEESSVIVGKLNCIGPLITILKTVSRDSIVGRACRLIGNLSQRTTNAEILHNHGVVSALITLVEQRDKNTSYPTLTMAVRAIRQLWMVPEKREEMLGANAIRCVALLLTMECESAGIIKSNSNKECDGFRKSQEELVTGILKCLGYFTTLATTQCAEQISGDGRGYQCLVALTKSFETLSLKCLMNLCYISSCRPLLGTAGLVECLVGILRKNSEIAWWPEGAALSLAQLSGESVNRSRLRHAQGLPLLLAAAKHNSHAMHALLQYVFDDNSFQILVNEGLITLLTEELIKHVTTMESEHTNLELEKFSNTKHTIKTTDIKSNSNESDVQKSSTFELSLTNKNSLFKRRYSQMKNDEEDLVIERDNMIVGFVDAVDSDGSEDSDNDDQNYQKRKGLKRSRSQSPKDFQKKSQLIKIASKTWSASVYWEPKSPEWPTPLFIKPAMSPERGNQSPLSPYSESNNSGFSPEYRGASSSKRMRCDWSPESGISSGEASASPYWTEYQWSPSSSSGSPHSPFSVNDESSDSEMSGRYSPVCSEGDAEITVADLEDSRANELDAAQVAHDLDDLIMDDESVDEDSHLEEDVKKIKCNSKSSRIACVMVLLYRVSHGASHGNVSEEPLPNNMELLTNRECLNALLDYVERCQRPLGRAARILAKVLSNTLCLMNILKHRLVIRLHSMSVNPQHPPTSCQQCKQILRLSAKLLAHLTTSAESGYGIGEISYQLLKGCQEMKQTLCFTLPYIVRSVKPLKKYFIDCNALNLLITMISDLKEDIQDCVIALAKLAINVHIKDPKTLENRFKDHVNISYDPILDNLSLDEIVTFELDDLSTVQANKVYLCQNSDVFCAMLLGCFKESIDKSVRLQNVTKPALEYLLTLLQCGLNNPKSEVQVFPMAEDLETNLEVLLLADRFLFERLKDLLSSAILQFKLNPETADRIYIWSLSDGMGFLCVESVAYLLTGKMCETERTNSFKNILKTKYKEQWLDDIKNMILRQLVK